MALTNEQLFDLIKDGNEDLKPVLWERVRKLAYMFASQFYRRNGELCRSRGLEEWDIKQLSYIAYASLFDEYDSSKQYTYATALKYALSKQLRGALGKSSDTLNRIVSSLDELVTDEEDGRTVADLIADENSSAPFEDLEDSSEQKNMHNALTTAIQQLPEKEQEVINKYYFDNRTYKSIGDEAGLSIERIRTINSNGLRHLRNPKILKRLREDLGYSSYRLYSGKRDTVEYIATERVYLEEIYKQYAADKAALRSLQAAL